MTCFAAGNRDTSVGVFITNRKTDSVDDDSCPDASALLVLLDEEPEAAHVAGVKLMLIR